MTLVPSFCSRVKDIKQLQHGFTLIEMLIAVMFVGIIAGVAYPSYTRYVERSLRMDARAGLLQAAAELERCYFRHYTYANCTITSLSPNSHYAITVTESHHDDGRFLIAAATSRKDGCGVDITLSALGERLPEECW